MSVGPSFHLLALEAELRRRLGVCAWPVPASGGFLSAWGSPVHQLSLKARTSAETLWHKVSLEGHMAFWGSDHAFFWKESYRQLTTQMPPFPRHSEHLHPSFQRQM